MALNKYKSSDKGKIANKRYRKTDKRKKVQQKYDKSENGIITNRLKANRYNEKKKCVGDSCINLDHKTIKRLKLLFNNACFKCGEDKCLEIEHHYPLSKGFGLLHDGFNISFLCRSCNAIKATNFLPNFTIKKN